MNLPLPSPDAQQNSLRLQAAVTEEIRRCHGWIPFSRFMEMALYTPQYGYYTGGSTKIGAEGDFVTAPTLTPLFASTLADQLNELLACTDGNIYEFGAGTGHLAAGLIPHLSDKLNRYYIIEVSPELAERQQNLLRAKLPEKTAQKIIHLNHLPEYFDGIIIGNEVLDAMPIERVRRNPDGTFDHIGVSLRNTGFEETARPLTHPELLQTASCYFPHADEPYTSELHLQQNAFIRTLARRLERGGMIFIDYGFDAAQYYHPQRSEGTLIGHYRHHVVHDPFTHLGLTDLTAHVNFTDIALAATEEGLDLIGYLPQSHFLLNLDIAGKLMQIAPVGTAEYHRAASAVQKLIDQHEMGELFKVIALGKNLPVDWTGFRFGDICHKL